MKFAFFMQNKNRLGNKYQKTWIRLPFYTLKMFSEVSIGIFKWNTA